MILYFCRNELLEAQKHKNGVEYSTLCTHKSVLMAARQQQLSGASCRPFSDTLSWVDLYEQIGITDYVEYKKKGGFNFG